MTIPLEVELFLERIERKPLVWIVACTVMAVCIYAALSCAGTAFGLAATALPAARVDYLRNLASGNVDGAVKRMSANILEFWDRATLADRKAGQNWYDNAHRWAYTVGRDLDFPTSVVAHVTAALSPFNRWSSNKDDAVALLKGVNNGIGPARLTVQTFDAQKIKAWNIAFHGDPQFQGGKKTENFAENIARPWEPHVVTIDRHALGVALKATRKGYTEVSLSDLRYRNVARAYRHARDVLRARNGVRAGLPAHAVQATCWLVYRRMFGDKQPRFERNANGEPILFPGE